MTTQIYIELRARDTATKNNNVIELIVEKGVLMQERATYH